MQEIINRILEGHFDYENGSLDFSCAKIELTLLKGNLYEGSFSINSVPGRLTNGYVVSSDLRMECLTPEFSGSSVQIAYRFHGEHAAEGDVVKGAFYVISNQGEYLLPFTVTVVNSTMESSIGSIRNLFHFANLAKSNWQEAVRMFYLPQFQEIFTGSDAQYLDCYRGLSANVGNEQNVEEFLICINKKQKVEYLTKEESIKISMLSPDSPDAVTETQVGIVKNGWGCTALNVECEGEFLFVEKEFLSEEDFTGNVCRLPVFIDTGRCRHGRNYGQIFLFNSYTSLTVSVEVQIGEGDAGQKTRRSRKQLTVQLMKAYESFRLKKMSRESWLKETGRLVDRLVAMDENDIEARLFQAQVLITEERFNEAGWILDHAGELIEKSREDVDVLYAYHRYLTTLIDADEEYQKESAARVEQLYRRRREEWRLAWLLLYLSEEYNRSATGKWAFLEKQAKYGCTSPVLYIEALNLLGTNPPLLRRLDEYELRVLYYGARNESLSDEVVEQVLYLCGRKKEYSGLLFGILKKLYEHKPDVRILQEICALLIKGGKTGTRWLDWYQKGVDANLRITNLYEYYLMSVDLEVMQPIPKMALMYFSYQCNLDYEHTAYLYHYLWENREAFPDLYESYGFRIEHFVIEQIQKGHINKHLAALYSGMLTDAMVTDQTAEPLTRLTMAYWVRVEDSRLKKVLVYQPGRLMPEEYPLQDNCAWIALYGEESVILFEDGYGNRFAQSMEYSLEKLMQPGHYPSLAAVFVQDNPGLDLYLMDREKDRAGLTPENVGRYRYLASSEEILPEIRRECTMKVLRYYYDGDDGRALDEYLDGIDPENLGPGERSMVLRYLVIRNKQKKACEWVMEYTPYFAEPKVLLRLFDDVMGEEPKEEDPVWMAVALYIFQKGKYDSCVLRYLLKYCQGPARQLRDIWKAAVSFELDCFEICERMLLQMLYTGAFVAEKMDIFRCYVSGESCQKIEEAFLSQCAYGYFVKQKIEDESVFDAIKCFYQNSGDIPKVCKLAFLKYYAENPGERTKEDEPLICIFLQEMLAEKIYMNFFRAYQGICSRVSEMEDKTIIEYRTRPGGRARIHYVVVQENGESGEYTSEYMKDVYGGVCFKEFVLFFGENLQYYIMEEYEGESQLTESGNLQKSDITGGSGTGRFGLINDIVISKTLQDYDTLDHMLEEYYCREYMNGELFRLQ